ncbi:hypothetical protein E1264_03820 [Actinomadura sp. KC216]|uniref:hypothetical protein n=1 Tax=Actinomadura sp. KC216 TaxID=2530370 RepID=UPI001048DF8A|nr:hypothetical protein [Actinomadura sp. KC216]TDB90943.1 hypothetical protein E1264_03820 [Actinomadura sp. KC216]
MTDHRHSPETTVFVNTCVGNPAICTMTPITTAASWELHLKWGEDRGWTSVNPAAYYKCKNNMRYPECAQ